MRTVSTIVLAEATEGPVGEAQNDGGVSESSRSFERREYPCALCGSSRKRLLGTKRGALIAEDFRFVKCQACGHVFVDPRIADEQLGGLYDEAYYFGRGFDHSIDYRRNHSPHKLAEAANVRETVAAAFEESLHGKKWLEFGCGGGYLLKDLIEHGVEAFGFDDSQVALDICAQKGLPLVSHANFEQLKGGFDVLSALEVIEHVPDPRGFLAFLASFLKIGGILVVQTGNWNVVRRIPGTPYLMPEGHIHYFTPGEMRRLFADVGFEELPVLNQAWYVFRGFPMPYRSLFPRSAFKGIEAAVRAIAPQYAQFPIGRRVR